MRLRTFFFICLLLFLVFIVLYSEYTEIIDAIKQFNVNSGNLLNVIITVFFATLVAITALQTHAAVNLRNKRIDVILHCNSRYDMLYQLRYTIESNETSGNQKTLIDSYFRRYWGIQSDQLDYWFAGYIDPETMASWISALAKSLQKSSVGTGNDEKSYLDSWKEMEGEYKVVNARLAETVLFINLKVNKIVDPEIKYAVILQWLRILEENEQILIRNLSKNIHSRMTINDLAMTLQEKYWQQYERLETRPRSSLLINKLNSIGIRRRVLKHSKSGKKQIDKLYAKIDSL